MKRRRATHQVSGREAFDAALHEAIRRYNRRERERRPPTDGAAPWIRRALRDGHVPRGITWATLYLAADQEGLDLDAIHKAERKAANEASRVRRRERRRASKRVDHHARARSSGSLRFRGDEAPRRQMPSGEVALAGAFSEASEHLRLGVRVAGASGRLGR